MITIMSEEDYEKVAFTFTPDGVQIAGALHSTDGRAAFCYGWSDGDRAWLASQGATFYDTLPTDFVPV